MHLPTARPFASLAACVSLLALAASAAGQAGPASAAGQAGPASAAGQTGPAPAAGQTGPAPAAEQAGPAASPRVIEELTRCRQVADPQRRLACYDVGVAALADATEKRAVVVLDRAEVQRTRRSLFGFPLPRLPFFGGDDGEDGKAGDGDETEAVRQIETRIVSVRSVGYGFWTMTLAEGGMWRTAEVDRKFTPAAGQAIVIKRGPFGGYLASVGGRRPVRVQRSG